jgi:hypothetical protein
MGYVGLLGLGAVGDGQANTTKFAVESCGIFHALAAGAQVLALLEDGIGSTKGATIFNLHLWVAVGFCSIKLGWLK